MMPTFSDNWSPFGIGSLDSPDVYYRKFELYEMGWQKNNVDLGDFPLIAAQTNGGNIALVRDEKKKSGPPPAGASNTATLLSRPAIAVFSGSGKLISQFVWTSGPLIQIGWSSTDELVCVQDDGRVLIYDMFGTFIRTFGMGQEAADMRVLDAKVFENGAYTGVAVLTGSRRYFVVGNIAAPAPILRGTGELPGPTSLPLPSCWTVMCSDRDVSILLARESTLLSADKTGQFQILPLGLTEPTRGIVAMALSPSHKLLALVTTEGIIATATIDSGSPQVYSEFVSDFPGVTPTQLAWCGNNAVVGYWVQGGHMVKLIGPKKEYIDYYYDFPLQLVSEKDCLRVITRDTHDMLQKVPTATFQLMHISSTAPGGSLLNAYREYENLSYKAEAYLRTVKEPSIMEEAIAQCIDAAGQEFDIVTQKLFLRAASFGKAFFDSVALSEKFVLMCTNLRILNALRFYRVGMPLTWKQFEGLSVAVLIDKLLSRREYELAYRICAHLKLPAQEGHARILLHWSSYKMNQRNEPDEQVSRSIIAKLEQTPGVSFAECARKARSLGRTRLAIDLLEQEKSPQLQIPLLLEFNKEDLALTKAITSGNSDLVYDVILHLKAKMSLADFLMKIRGSREVFALFIKYCKELNPKMLRELFIQEDWHTDEGMTFVPEAYFEKLTATERMTALQNAVERFDRAKDEFNKKVTEEQMKLIKHQMDMEMKFGGNWVGSTVHQTLEGFLADPKLAKLADAFKKDFQVADRHFWLLKIDVLAKSGQWEELEKFSKSVRKPPVGFEAFALAAFKYHSKTEAQKYAVKADDDQKVRCLLRIGLLDEAADAAIKQKDPLALDAVLEKCRREDSAVASRVTAAKTQFGFN